MNVSDDECVRQNTCREQRKCQCAEDKFARSYLDRVHSFLVVQTAPVQRPPVMRGQLAFGAHWTQLRVRLAVSFSPACPKTEMLLACRRWYSPWLRNGSSLASSDSKALELTDAALLQLRTLRQRHPDRTLRVAVEPGGCHGFQYKFTLNTMQQREPDDMYDSSIEPCVSLSRPNIDYVCRILREGEADGTAGELLCDPVSWDFIRQARLDYTQELIGSAFVILDNPSATSGCGCGVSFGLKDK